MSWIVENAGVMLTYYGGGRDGQAALERHGLEVHEAHGKVRREHHEVAADQEDPDSCTDFRLRDGPWFGLDSRTGEVCAGTSSGVAEVRTIKKNINTER